MCALFMQLTTWAQSGTITGKVVDEKGEGIPGATVRVKGTNKGAVTDMNGNFVLSSTNDADVLVVSAIGMESKEISARDNVSIKLNSSKKSLNEVVVTALAIEKEQKSLGYSSATVSGSDLTEGQDRTMLSGLQGKVAGVNITNTSGSPAGGTRVVIRGGSSILGNNQALIVVDGVVYNNGNQQNGGDNLNNQLDMGNRASDINPNDILSMTVLKGPAATTLYGSRGSNGAIIITTKRGNGGGTRGKNITLSQNYGLSSILMYPEFQNTWGQGYGGETHTEENWSWGPKFDGLLRPWGNVVDGKQKIKPFIAQPNNIQDFFRRGRTWETNLSIGGSNLNSNYYLSFNNFMNQGIVENSGYRRNSVRFNGGTEFSPKLSVQTGWNYIKSKSNLFAMGQANNSFYDNLYQTPRDIPIRELRDLEDPFNTPDGYYGAYTANPYFVVDKYKNEDNVDRIAGNVDVIYKPRPWLDVLNRTTADNFAQTITQYSPKYNYWAGFVNDLGQYSVGNLNYTELNNDLMLTARKNLAKNLSLTALLGHNVRQQISRASSGRTSGGIIANDWYNLDNSADTYIAGNSLVKRRWVGVYTDLGFNYNDYLFLNLTARNDWSSTLPVNQNSYFYPSASMAFVFSDLMKKEGVSDDILSYGKLRLSTGRVGNDADPYLTQNVLIKSAISDGYNNSQLNFPIAGTPAVSVSNVLANPNIKPELIGANEFGMELGFFDDRISMDFSVYRNLSRNLIMPIDLPGSSGYSSGVVNAGKLRNSGIELLLRGTPIKSKKGFTWEIFTTYARNNSIVEELYGDQEQLSLGGFNGVTAVAAVGLPYGTLYMKGPEKTPDGKIICDPNTGMPILSDKLSYYGSYNPDWIGSIGSDFKYKGFKLHFLFFHKQGGQMYSRLKNIMEFVGTSSTTAYNDREPFVVPNSVVETSPGVYEENTTKVDAETFWTEQSNNEFNLLPSTFTKLRELSLSYSIPKHLLNKMPFGVFEVGLYGNNLLLWNSKQVNEFGQRINTFLDPEINGFGTGNVQGIEFGTVPSLRNYGINLRITF